jgi:signal transduction histidine kinase
VTSSVVAEKERKLLTIRRGDRLKFDWLASHDKRCISGTPPLAARDIEHDQRILRVEHDLKSPLGAILGFSTLLRESVHEHLQEAPPSVLKSVNGIDQAARKILRIIEAAGARNSYSDRQEAVIERSH